MALAEELERGERLLWSGQPRQGVILRAADAFLIPFSLFWCGFVVLWEYMAITGGGPIFMAIFGIPFVLVGSYLLFGRFYVDALQRRRTVYGITTERVIIRTGVVRKRVQSLMLRTLHDVSLSEARDGSGTITFGQSFPFAQWVSGMSWPGMSHFLGHRFDAIENVKDAYRTLRDAQQQAA